MARRSLREAWLFCALLIGCGEQPPPTDHFAAAERLAAEGKYTEAVAASKRALTADAQHLEARLLLAYLDLVQGRLGLAAQLAEQAVQLDPDKTEAYLLLGDIYVRQRRNADAATIYKEGLIADPGRVDLYRKLAMALADDGHYTEAAATLQKALERAGDNAAIHHNLGVVYER